ncbi:ergosterol biosynthesis ERG4/ERG24 [Mycotypha africana]|uniref:ergosterol biosynthesis ERG4/ERG24 n=1 Tax=Mycotypha africana TaxID=64632 RepID=UPI002301427F|nr:ergosterol biosynthesis ERG4/ERG24 [Mycotypha africana]KAI8988217.1 ergosterol biosynthesis ERG4/ERG24 [Mycotypha africana]
MAKPVQRKKQQTPASKRQQQQTAAASSSNSSDATNEITELNPKTTHYEFGGPIGALGMITFLPLLVLFFSTCCDSTGYPSKAFMEDPKGTILSKMTLYYLYSMIDPSAFLVYTAFVAILALFYAVLPGDLVPGTELRNGKRLKYRMNGFRSFHTFIFAAIYFLKSTGLKPLEYAYDHYIGLAFASIVFSYAISLAVYLGSFGRDKLLALGGNSGNPIYDFMIGRELNPRVGSFDIKFFTELRPGLIGWLVLNYCLAAKQYRDLGYLSNSMVLVQFFQSWYVIDSLWNEEAVLTTMDITTDGFGFMLAFGLYTWVPFTYTLQARYLVDFPRSISWAEFCGILALNFLGYYIFRSANSQKNEFRSNPNSPQSKKLKYIQTKRGSKLITSGWWGVARHINYLGDWLMSLSWSLPCGFGSPIPYFYPVYFAVLLIHREKRDDHKCRTKYGEDWEKYCRIVKYKIIPGIY